MSTNSKTYPSHLTLRLSPHEWERLWQDAGDMNMGASEYVRLRVFSESAAKRRHMRGKDPTELEQISARILFQIGRYELANSLKQLANESKSGNLQPNPETNRVIVEIHAWVRSLRADLIEILGIQDRE